MGRCSSAGIPDYSCIKMEHCYYRLIISMSPMHPIIVCHFALMPWNDRSDLILPSLVMSYSINFRWLYGCSSFCFDLESLHVNRPVISVCSFPCYSSPKSRNESSRHSTPQKKPKKYKSNSLWIIYETWLLLLIFLILIQNDLNKGCWNYCLLCQGDYLVT